jgi:hypothetical protein
MRRLAVILEGYVAVLRERNYLKVMHGLATCEQASTWVISSSGLYSYVAF